jgi:hypothetical protein
MNFFFCQKHSEHSQIYDSPSVNLNHDPECFSLEFPIAVRPKEFHQQPLHSSHTPL